MPNLKLHLCNLHPIVSALVGVSGPWKEAGDGDVPASLQINLLIDTGATQTCIDPAILDKLGIQSTGSMPIHTPSTNGEAHDCLQYDVSLQVPAVCNDPYLISALPVLGAKMADPTIDGLLGRDILEKCVFIYDGPRNIFTLSFLPWDITLASFNSPPSASSPHA